MAPWAHQLSLLQTIPGVGGTTAQVFIAETGGDLSRFPSAAHLASWAGVAPAMHESAGQRSRAGTRHGNKLLTSMLVEAAKLVEAANSAARTKNTYLAHSSPGSPPGAGTTQRRSRWRTRSWSRRTTC